MRDNSGTYFAFIRRGEGNIAVRRSLVRPLLMLGYLYSRFLESQRVYGPVLKRQISIPSEVSYSHLSLAECSPNRGFAAAQAPGNSDGGGELCPARTLHPSSCGAECPSTRGRHPFWPSSRESSRVQPVGANLNGVHKSGDVSSPRAVPTRLKDIFGRHGHIQDVRPYQTERSVKRLIGSPHAFPQG